MIDTALINHFEECLAEANMVIQNCVGKIRRTAGVSPEDCVKTAVDYAYYQGAAHALERVIKQLKRVNEAEKQEEMK